MGNCFCCRRGPQPDPTDPEPNPAAGNRQPGAPLPFVASLDFGTTFSGYAFAKRQPVGSEHEPGRNITVSNNWPVRPQGDSLPGTAHPIRRTAQDHYSGRSKTMTSLLYEQSGDGEPWMLKDWGWPATVAYYEAQDQQPQDSSRKLKLVERFKLHLEENTEGPGMDTLELPESKNVRDCITEYLTKLSDKCVYHLREVYPASPGSTQFEVGKKDVHWFLTVPAMWGEETRNKMARLAKRALRDGDSMHRFQPAVTILSEPEAAIEYCLSSESSTHCRPGGRLLVDAGGGTVDVAYIEEGANHCLPAEGAPYGASNVDTAFVDWLRSDWAPFRSLQASQKDRKVIIQTLQQEFAHAKSSFKPSAARTGGSSVRLGVLPKNLHMQLQRHADGRLTDTLQLPREQMESFFEGVVGNILEFIDDYKGGAPGRCTNLILVGGFAEVPYLLAKIKDRFDTPEFKVVKPTKPVDAILIGAVIYGRKRAEPAVYAPVSY